MRILAVDLGAERRGGQRQTFLVFRELSRRGHAVAVAARSGAPLAEDVRAAMADREPGRPGSDSRLFEIRPGSEASPRVLSDMARAVHAHRPDVLYAGDARGHGALLWSRPYWRRAFRKPPPFVVHRRVTFSPRSNPLSRLKYGAVDLYFAVSRAVESSLANAGIPQERVVSIPDGLPEEAFVRKTRNPPPFRLVHVGAFDGQKGQRLVIEVLSRLLERGHDVQVTFLGDGPEREVLEGLVKRMGLEARCEFAGVVLDVPERLAASDLLLLPSASEAAPLVLVEAMAAGCPAVAHDVGGCSEILEGGGSGGLVPDLSLASWVEAVESLLGSSETRARLSEAGRETASRRTLARTVDLIERELLALVGKAEGKSA